MRTAGLSVLIIAIVAALYSPVTNYPFVNYDDGTYVKDNPHLRYGLTWNTVKWAFVSFENSNWHPLTWISHALDVELFGLSPSGHHLTNLVLHALNSVILFLLAFYSTRRRGASLVLALLFAVHPVNVESVVWIAERKNVLSTLLFFLTLGAYGWYTQRPHWMRYSAMAILFSCGLMAKPMLVTLPFVLLLLDYWPLERMRGKTDVLKLTVEKLPLLALSIASSIVTFRAQASGKAMSSAPHFPLAVRLENAIMAYGLYLSKAVWPSRLAVFYPHPGRSVNLWGVAASGLVLAAITGLCFVFRDHKYLVTGWCWFLGTLVPVIGIVQVGDQAMADRYAYIPFVGLFLMGTWAASDFFTVRGVSQRLSAAIATAVLLAFAFIAHRQIGYWSSDEELWSHTLAVTTDNALAHAKLGWDLMTSNELEEALPHLRAAVDLDPTDPLNYINLGICLDANQQPALAIDQYKRAIGVSSDPAQLATAYTDLGAAYYEVGNYSEAHQSYDRALQLNPSLPDTYFNRGLLFAKEGRMEEAVADYQRSIELRPAAKVYFELSRALERMNRIPEAEAAYEKAAKFSSDRDTQ